MTRALLRVPIEAGSSEFIEVEVDAEDLGSSVDLIAGGGPDIGTASFSLASSLNRIMPALSAILMKLRQADHSPDEIAMEVGITIGGETGMIFAKGTAEANLVINLSWRRPVDTLSNGA